jgi:hypothetical protein
MKDSPRQKKRDDAFYSFPVHIESFEVLAKG